MFQKDRFIEACSAAVAEDQKAVRELVAEAVADPAAIIAELGEPSEGGVFVLHGSQDMTVINFVWSPCMTLMPHDHNMAACIGIYGGREDNVFWRRRDGDGDGGPEIEAAGAESMGPGQVASMGPDIIHSVANPLAKLTAAIHVYGGDFFDPPTPRKQWDHETHTAAPYDIDYVRSVFAQAQVRFDAGQAAGNRLK